MARTKEFDPDATLQAALELFWRQGYEATSMQDLVEHLGVNRASLYATYGSKHDLYLHALDRYCELRGIQTMTVLNRRGPALAAVRDFIRGYLTEVREDPDHKGCLVTNTATELLPRDAKAARRVEIAFGELEAALAGALTRAQHEGDLAPGKDPRALARFLVTFVQGLRVVGKTDDVRRVDEAVDQALSLLA
ncbi:TetR/AcrR family transcriptional regulator [Amycolatopsis viridis]|uniref:TetR/AcrR family transcriptional repressor of nem operon n=1 Tax=Amycolatopsis viridis TaxID=185678 RepID=A0ABX0T0S5_9PSEU|nr:TetR/AcrR family transcriptional regulator [Amycolatopsis viridis]NIH81494.1 TetR/AcrR family transcriptional repressor of nem operon [Amycolatopsis viridis]